MRLRIPLILFTALSISSAIGAEYRQGAVRVSRVHARATAPGQTSAAVYLTIANNGSIADRLMTIETPVADNANLHTMSMEGDVMKMREVDGLALAPAATITMVAGHGYHIMLTGLHHPLVTGQSIALILRFKKAGVVKTKVTIDALTSMP